MTISNITENRGRLGSCAMLPGESQVDSENSAPSVSMGAATTSLPPAWSDAGRKSIPCTRPCATHSSISRQHPIRCCWSQQWLLCQWHRLGGTQWCMPGRRLASCCGRHLWRSVSRHSWQHLRSSPWTWLLALSSGLCHLPYFAAMSEQKKLKYRCSTNTPTNTHMSIAHMHTHTCTLCITVYFLCTHSCTCHHFDENTSKLLGESSLHSLALQDRASRRAGLSWSDPAAGLVACSKNSLLAELVFRVRYRNL